MKPDPRFRSQPPTFWAYVRSISEWVGYTNRKNRKDKVSRIKVPSPNEIWDCLHALQLAPEPLLTPEKQLTELGQRLQSYFEHRAEVLNNQVEPALQTAKQAAALFSKVRKDLKSQLPVPMNKQKGEKKKPAYFTGLVNMLIDAHRGPYRCDYDPRVLTAFTKGGVPVRTLSRRVDGAFPAAINPAAIWEIKEYYYTTTFGSRVADGVYETQLDGMEIEEMRVAERIVAKHYLFLDAHYTWWECGKSYLCRIFDMVNMGLVDEAIVGRDVVTRVPELVAEWIGIMKNERSIEDLPKAPLDAGAGNASHADK
ncbi:DUF7687 domain-containing protein [Nibricoccus aquaticus]|uniref:DUF7687 domain-containing protein n=1 Tax=Nibricoccus aquaticus TaxID=2576891 RepID=UPI001585E38E|nr:hypothetical protein [Nibricoccus aquaticus]